MKPAYKKGDIILVRFPFTHAGEFKVRPALVIRDQDNEDLSLLPISTKIKLHRNDIIIQGKNYKSIPLPVESVIRLSKMTTIHGELALKKITELKTSFFKEVQLALFRYLA